VGFNYKWLASGTAGGVNLTRCLLHFAPRYLCNNYSSKNPRDLGQHIVVNTRAAGASAWAGATSVTLNYTVDATAPGSFTAFFADMIGITSANAANAASYVPIASEVLSGANVSAMS
jgi:hypothetical protein